jgi:hypothetical protein
MKNPNTEQRIEMLQEAYISLSFAIALIDTALDGTTIERPLMSSLKSCKLEVASHVESLMEVGYDKN